MAFINIKNLLSQSLSRNRIKPQVEATNVLIEFTKLVKQVWGKEVAELVEPKYVKNRILYIHCNSSTAASALSLAKSKIVEEINKAMKDELIKDIIFWQ